MTWATSVPILVFLGLSVLDIRPDVRDRQTDRRQTDRSHTDVRRQTKASLNAPPISGAGHNNGRGSTTPNSDHQLPRCTL